MSMESYRIELATAEDDPGLRAVMAATPMHGAISVAFHREPSFFAAQAVEGPFRQVLLARHDPGGQIVGLGSRSIRQRYCNGEPTPVGYLSSLRLLQAHRQRGLVARGFRLLKRLHADGRAPLYLTAVAQDNPQARELLTSGRAGLPRYHPAGLYHTLAIPVGRKLAARPTSVEIREARREDLPAVLEFLRRVGPRRQFFPCYDEADFRGDAGTFRDLAFGDLMLAYRNGRIVGTLAAWDQRRFRQEVIQGYAGALRLLRPVYNIYAGIRGQPRLPEPGAALRCLMAALPVVEDDDAGVFSALVDTLLHKRSGHAWDYLMIGMHEADPLLPSLRGLPARWYTTCVYTVCWEDGLERMRSLDGRPWYLELGTL